MATLRSNGLHPLKVCATKRSNLRSTHSALSYWMPSDRWNCRKSWSSLARRLLYPFIIWAPAMRSALVVLSRCRHTSRSIAYPNGRRHLLPPLVEPEVELLGNMGAAKDFHP